MKIRQQISHTLLVIMLLAVSTQTFATSDNPCPHADQFRFLTFDDGNYERFTEPFDRTYTYSFDIVIQFDDTKKSWHAVTTDFSANTEKNARDKANAILASITDDRTYEDRGTDEVCSYPSFDGNRVFLYYDKTGL